jgi:hypothetical protein
MIAIAFSSPIILISTCGDNNKPQTINHKPFKAVQRKDFLLMFFRFLMRGCPH